MALHLDSSLDLARDKTEFDWELCLGESAVECRVVLALLRLVLQVKRGRIGNQPKRPAEAILFPTECWALQVGLVFPFVVICS